MKKITISSRAKKVATFAGMLVVCVGAVFLVMSRVNASEPEESPSSGSSEPSEIVLGTLHPISAPESSSSGTGSAFVPSSGASASEPLTTVSKPTSTPPNPTPPASSALTDKTKKPTYASKPAASKSTTSKSAAGYNDPVFGNKTSPTGGKGITDNSMYEDGVKIGTMD